MENTTLDGVLFAKLLRGGAAGLQANALRCLRICMTENPGVLWMKLHETGK